MDAEEQRARQLADLLDDFRPEEGLTVEEREFLKLREQMQALQISADEIAALKGRVPQMKAVKNNRRIYWRGVFTGAAAVAVLIVAALGIDWLIRGSPPFAAVRRQDVTPSALALVPEICSPETVEVPGDFGLGGGRLDSGDFEISLWLDCDPGYGHTVHQFSEIDGLTVAYSWTYHGDLTEGTLVTFPAVEPYMMSIDGAYFPSEPLKDGLSETGKFGLELPAGILPDWKSADARLRYVVKLLLPNGTIEGAALNFTLQREADGFRPVDVTLEPLAKVERGSAGGSLLNAPPFPLLALEDVYPELGEVYALLERRQAEMTRGGGWIHWEFEDTDAGEVLETWWLVDEIGSVQAVIYTDRAEDGSRRLVTRMQNNRLWISPTDAPADSSIEGMIIPPMAYLSGLDMLGQMLRFERSGQDMEKTLEEVEGRQAWVITLSDEVDPPEMFKNRFEAVRWEQRYIIDAESGQFLTREDIYYDADGNAWLASSTRMLVEERVTHPPDEVMAFFDEPLPAVPATADEDFHLPGAAQWKGPKLAPEVCVGRAMDDDPEVYERLGIGNLNGNLLGGGQIQSGDFTFDYWLVCDFQLENSSRNLQSEISGLGIALKWTYNGPGQDGKIVIYSGIEPYINQALFSENASANQSGIDLQGIELPGLMLADWNAQDTPLRWAVKAVLPDGSIAGAALTFTLMRGEDGFTPVNIELVPLSAAELGSPAGVEVSEPQFALLEMDVVYPELADIHALITQHELEALSGPGWIYRTNEVQTDDRQYRYEIWTQLGETGNVLGEVQLAFQGGGLVSQSVNQNREAGLSESYRLLRRLLDAARYGAPAEESLETIDNREVRVFSFPNELTNPPIYRESIDGLVYAIMTREGVDARTGEYLFRESKEFDENGALVASTRITWSEETKEQAPEEILQLVEAPEEAEDFPNMPLEVLAWSCENPQTDERPSGGETAIGGGTLASGDFEFELWVICADRFRREASTYGEDFSLIDHLGLSVRWKYTGAAREGHVTPFGGIEPYVEQLFDGVTYQAIEPGLAMQRVFGINLPSGVIADWGAADTQLRYAAKVQLPDGRIEGAALVFSLIRSPEGLVVWAVAVEPLTEVERSGGYAAEVSQPPFALIPMEAQYPALAEIWPLIERRTAEHFGEGGWFHMAWQTDDGLTEGWFQVTERSKATRWLKGNRDAGGALMPTMVYQDGYLNDVEGEESGFWPPYDAILFEYGTLFEDLLEYARSGKALERAEVNEGGRTVWVYSFRGPYPAAAVGSAGVRVNRYGLDAESGELLWQERYEGEDDASLALVRRTARVVDERVEVPPEDVLRLTEEFAGP